MTLPRLLISLIALLLLVANSPARTVLAAAEAQGAGIKILVVGGEDGVNVIQQKTSVAPIVEVRDRNNLPIAGAVVVFAVPAGKASLNNGLQQVTAVTDASGRATVTVNPLSRGGLDIQVRATYQGQTATTTVRQANVNTQAEASQTMTNTAAAAGGLSAAAIGGIIGGGVAGTLVAVKAAGGGGTTSTPNQTPVAGGALATPSAAIAGTNMPIAFSVQASDADNNPLTYTWDFGDGASGTGPTPTHAYTGTGTFTVKVTVSDGKASATSQTTVTVRPFAGTWSLPGTLTMTFNLSGSNFTGTGVYTSLVPFGIQSGSITNGTLRGSSPRITFNFTFIQNVGGGCTYTWSETYSGDPLPDGSAIQVNVAQTITPNSGACGLGVRTTSFQTLLFPQ